LERADVTGADEVAHMGATSSDVIRPELRADERSSTSAAVALFESGHSLRVARLAALRAEAERCVGLPLEQGFDRLQRIMDDLIALADALEESRQTALQTISEPHLAAAAAGENA